MENQASEVGTSGAALDPLAPASKPLTAEFLKDQIAELKRRVLTTTVISPEKIRQEIQEQEAEAGKEENLILLVDQALGALERFEKQLKEHAHSEEHYAKQLEELNGVVESLERQRDEAIQKFENVEQQLETEEKTWFKEKAGEAMASLRKKIDGLVKGINEHAGELQEIAVVKEKMLQGLKSAKAKIDVVIQEQIGKLGPSHAKTKELLAAVHSSATYGEFLSGLAQHRKSLGWFSFKEKASLDALAAKSQLFLESDQKLQSYNSQVAAEKSLDAFIEKQVIELEALMKDAIGKQQALNQSFNLPPEDESWGSLPKDVVAAIEAGVKDSELWGRVKGRVLE